MEGRCLCGAVAFEFHGPATAIELCHCVRCRSASGSAFVATFYVKATDFAWLRGQKLIAVFDLPVREKPPAYRQCFCRACGSPLPIARDDARFVEIPAGLIEGDCGSRLIDQIHVNQKAPWWSLDQSLPSYDAAPPRDARMQMLRALTLDRK
jgi:hypothetical protein